MQRERTVRIGCCGWPEVQKRSHRDFDVFEVQETFYQPGRIDKYEKLSDTVPRPYFVSAERKRQG